MAKHLLIFTILVAALASAAAQDIPVELRGKWTIKRELPTATISCWGEQEAKAIIGTEIQYSADSFRWKDTNIAHPAVKVTIVSAEQFHDENSGQGANGSQVSFRQLGIRAARAKLITLAHAPANVGRDTTEIPGDTVLLKDKNTIIFSVCNVYFEGKRVTDSAPTR